MERAAFSIASVSASSSSPADVGTKRSGRRSNSRAPICCSSACTQRETVGWLTPSALAAVLQRALAGQRQENAEIVPVGVHVQKCTPVLPICGLTNMNVRP